MMRLPIVRIAACLAALLFLSQVEAKAGFTYTSVVTPGSTTTNSSTIGLTGTSSASILTSPTFINLFDVSVTTTAAVGSSNDFFVNFSDVLSITNSPPPGTVDTKSITITGNLHFTRSDTGGEVSFLAVDSPSFTLAVDGQSYTVSNFSYAPPTVNSAAGSGNVSALITSSPTAVPEPASVAMLGMGVVFVGGLMARRRSAK